MSSEKAVELVSIGYGGFISAGRLIAVVGAGFPPVKQVVTVARAGEIRVGERF